VRAAKIRAEKKIEAKILPAGIEAKIRGKVRKIKGGPLVGSSPNAKIAGIMTKPAVIAIAVSPKPAAMAEQCRSSFDER
jgi:hypothetical protein